MRPRNPQEHKSPLDTVKHPRYLDSVKSEWDRLAELDSLYETFVARAVKALMPEDARVIQRARNAKAGKRRRRGLPRLPSVSEELRGQAEDYLMRVAERNAHEPEAQAFLSMVRERDRLRGLMDCFADDVFSPRAKVVKEVVSMAQNGAARPTLVGLAEIADMLGVSKQRVYQLAQLESFPEPMARLAAGPVWAKSDVQAWAQENR